MLPITTFEPTLVSSLPATFELLMSSNLTVHPEVSGIVLHGSRGLAGGYRRTSDIDLSLIVDALALHNQEVLEPHLFDILETTRRQWQSAIEPDLAIVFETKDCALRCFEQATWNEHLCTVGGVDCFGLYKAGKGFHGLVQNAGVEVRRMYPCLKIWQRIHG